MSLSVFKLNVKLSARAHTHIPTHP